MVKTRMMAQASLAGGGAEQRLYRSSMDCLLKTVQKEGVGALYKGFFPTWSRLGPWQLTFWLCYEQMRLLFGMGSF